ncbi:hypothetical protein CALVIDRAFT_336611 [Calocera viscosa TUFC12733]|uniref:Uncharacterized protein n=1 Tax=Calocera viscosa (strain TUFC12733) TaxID=1330018 RepID=A0A167HIT8_CALVF|nr:hypothetical protein CALVIDRAFT_336611 [Calocera viscosa TUFC12733]
MLLGLHAASRKCQQPLPRELSKRGCLARRLPACVVSLSVRFLTQFGTVCIDCGGPSSPAIVRMVFDLSVALGWLDFLQARGASLALAAMRSASILAAPWAGT